MELTQRAQELIKKYDLNPPFIRKEAQADFYYPDFVQLLWAKWGAYTGEYIGPYTFFFIRHNLVCVFYTSAKLKEVRDQYLHLVEHDNFLERHYADWRQSTKNFEHEILNFKALDRNTSFEQYAETYIKFCDAYIYQYAMGIIPEAFGLEPEKWISPEIEAWCQHYSQDANHSFPLLTSPVNLSFVAEEELGLLRIALLRARGSSEEQCKDALSQHQAAWFWIRNNYSDIQVLSFEHFKDRLDQYQDMSVSEIQEKISHLEGLPEKHIMDKKNIFESFPPSDKLLLFIKLNEVFAEMQDVRKKFVLESNHYHQLFLQRLSLEYGIPLDELICYSHSEVRDLLQGGPRVTLDEVIRRRQCVFAITDQDTRFVLSGEEAEGIYQEFAHIHDDVDSLSGVIAQKGKVSGRVKIVMRSADISKVETGDIMVSSMTRPEMVAAMTKAAAFVTNEGGITCHAAIVAREMKKPCLIGTKSATKIFKDGDLVEVDADKGVVTLIERV